MTTNTQDQNKNQGGNKPNQSIKGVVCPAYYTENKQLAGIQILATCKGRNCSDCMPAKLAKKACMEVKKNPEVIIGIGCPTECNARKWDTKEEWAVYASVNCDRSCAACPILELAKFIKQG